MIVNLWMLCMFMLDKRNENTPKKAKKQQIEEY